MTTSVDRSQRPPRSDRERLSSSVRDELARLRGKSLGGCAACGRPVFFEHDFTRYKGRVVHVRCPISARPSSPMPLVVEGVVARNLTSRDR